ncbi:MULTISPECIES: hypothetical protein [unclassified Streptomyces]|uniref:hypothetical protein n=1 Tax=unclassified Streptomyces TaxID=2593676 RepID=UPI0036ED0861
MGIEVDGPNVVTESSWRFVGSGHTPGAALFTAGMAEDLATSRQLPREAAELGVTRTVADHFRRWSKSGTWKLVDEALTNTARVPVWVPELLPPMAVEGRVDPRMMLSVAEPSRARAK